MDVISGLTSTAGETLRQLGRPLVTLSYAQSLDGSLAARKGAPLRLSGPESMNLTHQARSQHDAILVGIGTVLADNPRLTVRLVQGPHPQPVVLDSHLRMPRDTHLLSGPRRPWIASLPGADPKKRKALESAGAQVFEILPGEDGLLCLPVLLARLAARGIASLMVEGGTEVIASFLRSGLVDQVLVTVAPVFVGGLHLPLDLLTVGQARISGLQVTRLGEDLIVYGTLEGQAAVQPPALPS